MTGLGDVFRMGADAERDRRDRLRGYAEAAVTHSLYHRIPDPKDPKGPDDHYAEGWNEYVEENSDD